MTRRRSVPVVGDRRRGVRVLAGLAVAAALLTGCSSARLDAGTSAEPCYLALPTASAAVHGHGHLAGVRRNTVNGLHEVAPRLYRKLADAIPAGHAVCLVAYTGHFDTADVTKPLGRPSGHLAIVVVATPGNELLGTLILTKMPLRFGHTFSV